LNPDNYETDDLAVNGYARFGQWTNELFGHLATNRTEPPGLNWGHNIRALMEGTVHGLPPGLHRLMEFHGVCAQPTTHAVRGSPDIFVKIYFANEVDEATIEAVAVYLEGALMPIVRVQEEV
jgi:hypothetical protein